MNTVCSGITVAEYARPGLARRMAAKPCVPNPGRGVGVAVREPEGVVDDESLLEAVMDADGVLEMVPAVFVGVLLGVWDGVAELEAVLEGDGVAVVVGETVEVGVDDGLGVHGTAAIPRHCDPDTTVATAAPLLLYVPVAGLNEYTAVAVAA